jgi:hypothetical protein
LNRTVPLILAVALFMENMDSTVIATSLPAIAADIGTSPVALKLALTAYLVSLAIFIPISSWMADRYGAKRVFRFAIAVFALGSAGCAAAGSLGGFRPGALHPGNGRRHDDAGREAGAGALNTEARTRLGVGLADDPRADWSDDRPAHRRFHNHLLHVALDFHHQCADRHTRNMAGRVLPAEIERDVANRRRHSEYLFDDTHGSERPLKSLARR